MSKYILRKRTSGFTTISNNVIRVLKSDLEVLGLYLYLLSLPDNWEFHKTHICKECHIGIKKLEKILKKLSSFELVQYGQKRNDRGQFEEFYMDIYDLESIKINNLENDELKSQPVGQNCRTVETVRRSGEAIKEVIQNKELLKNKKINISCSSKDDERNRFDDFWKIYKRKEKKKVAEKLWVKNKLNNIADKIINAVELRNSTDWKDKEKKYIPLPDTYLNQERWTDEINPHEKNVVQDKNEKILNNEIRCTVPEYGPGHPLFEANKEWELRNARKRQGIDTSTNNARGNSVRKAEDYLF